MEKTEKYYQQKIAEEIRHILDLEQNREAAKLFWEALDKIKPKSCIVKSGCVAGKYITFTLAFEKGGTENPFELFVSNIPDAAFRYGVIFGLNPQKFHYNPQHAISDETHSFVRFKLQKDG